MKAELGTTEDSKKPSYLFLDLKTTKKDVGNS